MLKTNKLLKSPGYRVYTIPGDSVFKKIKHSPRKLLLVVTQKLLMQVEKQAALYLLEPLEVSSN